MPDDQPNVIKRAAGQTSRSVGTVNGERGTATHTAEHARHFASKIDAQNWLDAVTSAVHDLGQPVLHIGHRKLLSSSHSHRYSHGWSLSASPRLRRFRPLQLGTR